MLVLLQWSVTEIIFIASLLGETLLQLYISKYSKVRHPTNKLCREEHQLQLMYILVRKLKSAFRGLEFSDSSCKPQLHRGCLMTHFFTNGKIKRTVRSPEWSQNNNW